MSTQAVGAGLLYEMEMEELVEKHTRDRFVERFAGLLKGSFLTYDQVTSLWRGWRERQERDIRRRYSERVLAWVPPPQVEQSADLSLMFGGSQDRVLRIPVE